MEAVITRQQYEMNIKDGRTLFAPVSTFSLGDQILFEVVRRKYQEDNPDEYIEFCGHPIYYDQKKGLNWDKIFHAEETNFVTAPAAAIRFSIADEATALAEQGMFARLPYHPTWGNKAVDTDEFFVVVHLRNVRIREHKNVDRAFADVLLSELVTNYSIDRIYLVGNDERVESEILNVPNRVVDYRKRLTLPEIAYLCQHAGLVINKDSGIGHLAAAADCSWLLTWGIKEARWVPKMRRVNRLRFLMEAESGIESVSFVLNRLLERLGKGKRLL